MKKKKELSIAQQIRKVREDINLSQADFAKLLGITQSTLCKYETEGKEHAIIPRYDMWLKIKSYKRGE